MRTFRSSLSPRRSPLAALASATALLAAACLFASPVEAQETAAAEPADAVETMPAETEEGLPFLWKVEKEGRTKSSFLFGTFHTSDKRVARRLGQVDWAIQASDALYTELEMDIAAQISQASKMMLPDGKSLGDVIPRATYRKLETYMRSRGQAVGPMDRMRPWVVAVQLSLLDMKDFNPLEVLDVKLYGRAAELGREVGGIERTEEQLAVFESLTAEEQALFLDSSLDYLIANPGKSSEMMESMVTHYMSGDENAIMVFVEEMGMDELAMGGKRMKELGERLMKRLLQDRNHIMAERMAAKMNDNPGKAYFFGVGLAHYPGAEGVVKLLEDRGFTITRVTEEEYIMNAGPEWDAPAAVVEKPAAPTSFPKGSLADRLVKKGK